MKRCANPKCGKIFYPAWNKNRTEYCPDCQSKYGETIWYDVHRMKHEKARVGNSKQDVEILAFLKKKKQIEDDKYKRLYDTE